MFNYKKNGVFVDLASSDGVHINNTYLLEKRLGWTGLCIEPNPQYTTSLRQNRSCRIDTSVIASKNGLVDFRMDNGELGGIVADDTDNNHANRASQLQTATIVQRETHTLEEVLDQHGKSKKLPFDSFYVHTSLPRAVFPHAS